ncbi:MULTISPECIES: anaerobic ribonucleoside-triphosphate reductase-activating protein [Vibrio]|uniref:Anaerobic ribonucleoside-triphosphate reductase-activating protein n=1 Tax=Vibrio halioticoli NBRC 102217 TaxID=1219072 RepID=V5F2Q2_9VIBR|nr:MULTISPECIES: anaerobic ribonucleoside-triphosphate reductase-activating protein [Vibrio]GAD89399.1 anaerobic ribonucleoside-triphosphate reductase activating protein [Vibrio halioticoli NBRC 102217]
MNYHNYYPVDVVNGLGTRCTLFVSGCIHQCRGCYNQSTWSPSSGHLFTQEMEDQVIADLNDTRIKRKGLSLSGGDPLYPGNLEAIFKLVKRVKEECPGKDIWMWTGYVLAELSEEQQQVVNYVDTLIDGKFEKDLADARLEWRGSSNQVIHRFTLD